jgi:hypothetical protein
LDRMADELRRFRDMLKDAQDEALLETFLRTQIEREAFQRQPPRRQMEATVAKVDSGQALLSMLVGGALAKNIQRAKQLPELMRQARETDEKDGKRRPTLAEKIAEDVRRDLEKLEQKRAENQIDTEDKSNET